MQVTSLYHQQKLPQKPRSFQISSPGNLPGQFSKCWNETFISMNVCSLKFHSLQFVILPPLVLGVHLGRGSIQAVKPCLCSWQSPLKWIFKNFIGETLSGVWLLLSGCKDHLHLFLECMYTLSSHITTIFQWAIFQYFFTLLVVSFWLGICRSNV